MATVTREQEELAKDAANFCALHGDSRHAAVIRQVLAAALAAPPAEDGSVMVRVDAAFVEQMRAGGLQGPFSRVELDEAGTASRCG